MGSQLRLQFEQKVKLLKKSVAQVAQRDQRIQAMESEKKNLEALLEAEADMKKVAEARNAELVKELESLGYKRKKIKAAFEEFKRYEDSKVQKWCAKIDARLDALSIDFDEELYPHMLTAIVGRRWVVGHGLRLAVMKCAESIELRQAFANVVTAGITKGMSEGLEYGVRQGEAKLDLAAIEAYDPKADDKYVAALHALKDLKYPLIDQLEKLRDAPLDLIMASLYLESDTGEDAPQWIQILLEDAIAANVIRAVKKKKMQDCMPHPRCGLCSSFQVDVSEGESSPKLIRSKSLPSMYNLDWP
ncbi:hypothetical protein Tco_0145197 [Tanacetum coccineum]